MKYLTEERTTLTYEMPLAEVVTDFFDEMKSRSKGYASMDYAFLEYRENDLIKLDVLINGELAEPLGTICHRCGRLRVRWLCSAWPEQRALCEMCERMLRAPPAGTTHTSWARASAPS